MKPRTLKYLIVLSLITLTSGVACSEEAPLPVGIIQLIATPEKYDGKLISVIGYLEIVQEEGHGVSITLSMYKEDADYRLSNRLLVISNKKMLSDREKIDGMYVELTGIAKLAHAENGVSGIVITDVREWNVRANPNRPIQKEKTPSGIK